MTITLGFLDDASPTFAGSNIAAPAARVVSKNLRRSMPKPFTPAALATRLIISIFTAPL
jgi:hypothetical protein